MTRAARILNIPSARPTPAPVRLPDLRQDFQWILRSAQNCLLRGRTRLSSKLQKRLDSLFTKFKNVCKNELPERFANNPTVPDRIEELFELTVEYEDISPIPINEKRRTNIERKMHPHLEALSAIYDRVAPPTSATNASSTAPTAAEKIRSKLAGKFTQDRLDDALAALEILSRGDATNGLYNKYVYRLCSNNVTNVEIAGAITELRAMLYISRSTNIEILDANVIATQKLGTGRMELFDIIGRDTDTGRLVLFEIKGDNGYGFGDFIFQFLGFGSQYADKIYKPLAQVDVLFKPDDFNLPITYAEDIKSGNYEIRIVTHRRLFDFDHIYGQRMVVRRLLNHLLLPSTPITSSGKLQKELTREKIDQEVIALRDRIIEEKHCLENVPFRFELLTWHQNPRRR